MNCEQFHIPTSRFCDLNHLSARSFNKQHTRPAYNIGPTQATMSVQPTRQELLSMAFMGQENFIPAAEEQRPPRFLSLAPTTSASYPSTPKQKSPAPQSPIQASVDTSKTMTDPTSVKALDTTAAMPSAAVIAEALKTRRSSSLSSDGSQKRRFLKLGPVHFGERGQGDWSEAVDE